MKVKLKNLVANPFRDIENYPIQTEKLEALKRSIDQTGFWDNLVAREKDGEIQIAYGHHRLQALRQIKNDSFEIDIPIKDLPDETMIKIMANENMESWSNSTIVIDETVKVTRQFLKNNPYIAIKYWKPEGSKKIKSVSPDFSPEISSAMVSRFLGWTKDPHVVQQSIQRLDLQESGTVKKAAIEKIKSPTKSYEFAKAVEKHKLPKSEQTKLANEIVNEDVSIKDVETTVEARALDLKFPNKPKPKVKKDSDEKVIMFLDYITIIGDNAAELKTSIQELNRFKQELINIPYDQIMERASLIASFTDLTNVINKFLKELKDEKGN